MTRRWGGVALGIGGLMLSSACSDDDEPHCHTHATGAAPAVETTESEAEREPEEPSDPYSAPPPEPEVSPKPEGPPGPLTGALVINEVYTKHQEDWVELYNGTDQDIDISGYRVLDDKSRTVVPPGSKIYSGYAFVLDRRDLGAENAFSLHEDADEVHLEDVARNELDSISWNETFVGMSLGRNPDGEGDFEVMTPTPGALNTP